MSCQVSVGGQLRADVIVRADMDAAQMATISPLELNKLTMSVLEDAVGQSSSSKDPSGSDVRMLAQAVELQYSPGHPLYEAARRLLEQQKAEQGGLLNPNPNAVKVTPIYDGITKKHWVDIKVWGWLCVSTALRDTKAEAMADGLVWVKSLARDIDNFIKGNP